MFYIYHIPGKKIGCTADLQKRMSDQGFTEWEILETHENGWLAGDREKELQEEYGYRVDNVHYMVARQNRRKWQPGDRPPMTSERAKWVRSHVKNPGVGKGAAQLAITKSKLRDKADKIRNDFKSWKSSKYQFELKTADEYGVSRSTITRILKKELY
jgi:hypothetical protein